MYSVRRVMPSTVDGIRCEGGVGAVATRHDPASIDMKYLLPWQGLSCTSARGHVKGGLPKVRKFQFSIRTAKANTTSRVNVLSS